MSQFDMFGPKPKAKKKPASKPASKASGAKKREKVAPCNACKGFEIKARTVYSVARDSQGRFKKPKK